MELSNIPLETLKHKLQQYGALRQEAWLAIQELLVYTELKPQQSFIRQMGQLAWVSQGLLKEYDTWQRPQPRIINFLVAKNCFYTNEHNKSHYLKAGVQSTIISLNFTQLMTLYIEFRELKPIYDALCAEYDLDIAYQKFLFEQSSAEKRILLFKIHYRYAYPYLKKKDMANYLNLNYSHLVGIWNKSS